MHLVWFCSCAINKSKYQNGDDNDYDQWVSTFTVKEINQKSNQEFECCKRDEEITM